MSNLLMQTLGNDEWMKANAPKIKNILPDTWTHIANLNGLQLGYQLKLLGIDWRSEDEFGKCMIYLESIGILKRDGMLIKRAL